MVGCHGRHPCRPRQVALWVLGHLSASGPQVASVAWQSFPRVGGAQLKASVCSKRATRQNASMTRRVRRGGAHRVINRERADERARLWAGDFERTLELDEDEFVRKRVTEAGELRRELRTRLCGCGRGQGDVDGDDHGNGLVWRRSMGGRSNVAADEEAEVRGPRMTSPAVSS